AAGVVEVHRERRLRHRLFQASHHVRDLGRDADADGVADRDLVAADVGQAARDVHDAGRIHRAFVGTAEAGRDVAADPHPLAKRVRHELLEAREGLVDGRVDVLAVEGLAGRGEDRDVARARGPRRFVSLAVGDEDGQAHAVRTAQAAQHLVRARHLRHPAWGHERARLDHGKAGVDQGLAEGHLVLDTEGGRFVLQAVTGPDLDHAHPGRPDHPSSTSTTPGLTMSPTRADTDFTRPSRGARTAFSIFMASTTSSSSPFITVSPAATFTAMTFPGMGASSPPPAWRCEARLRSVSSSSRYARPPQKRWTVSPSRTQ